MGILVLYWSFLAAAFIVASRLRRNGVSFEWVQPSMLAAIYVMCLIMGVRMGINEQITSNLGSIGLMSLVITAFCIVGSMVMIFIMRKIFGVDRYGDARQKLRTAENTEVLSDAKASDQLPDGGSGKAELKSTFTLLGVVAAGMLAGILILVPYCSRQLDAIQALTGHILTVLLCILLALVGLALGSNGNVKQSIRQAGIKILAFPLAAMLGTLILGTGTCLVMGFSMREAVAISMGFGWYTYAPVVIASAGPQFAVASAVSFMHNVMRELTGIIGIPFFARAFGYLECTVVPGAAAMDVCMPIVERACREDTVIYSFVTGLLMTITTSLLVPLVMGV